MNCESDGLTCICFQSVPAGRISGSRVPLVRFSRRSFNDPAFSPGSPATVSTPDGCPPSRKKSPENRSAARPFRMVSRWYPIGDRPSICPATVYAGTHHRSPTGHNARSLPCTSNRTPDADGRTSLCATSSIRVGYRPSAVVSVTRPHALPSASHESTTWYRQSNAGMFTDGATMICGAGVTSWRCLLTYRTVSTGIIDTSCAMRVRHDQTASCRIAVSDVTVGTPRTDPATRPASCCSVYEPDRASAAAGGRSRVNRMLTSGPPSSSSPTGGRRRR